MLSYLRDEVPSRALGVTRAIVGTAAVVRSLVALPVFLTLTEPGTLRLPYAEWMPAATREVVLTIFGLWFLSALAFALGWRVPLTGSALFAASVATLLIDQQLYGNHLYLMAWLVLLLTMADAGSGLPIGQQDRLVVRWPLLLIMAQVSIVYGFSALTKLNSDFMSGSVLAGALRDGLVSFPDTLRTPGFLSIVAASAVFVELFIALFLWSPRFRVLAVALGVGLHTSILMLMEPTGELVVFGLEMVAVYPLFLTRDQEPIHVD